MNRAVLIASLLILFCPGAMAAISGKNLLTGKDVDVKAGSKGTVAVFMSAKCPCSNSHTGLVKKLSEEFKDFTFVAVHSNADEEMSFAKSYFENVGFPFPVIEDAAGKLADQYKALKTPHAFLLSPDGKVIFKGGVTGSTDDPAASKQQYLRDALRDVQAGRPVKVSYARPLGCPISRDR
jgi:thioredoxin-related protein